jgi:UTP--glucose-1-phosphate uridylyltransferase
MSGAPTSQGPVAKAVIPAAGLGTRTLPASKAVPKEMMAVVDKPAIQYVVEEAVAAGLSEIVVVTGRGKQALEDHFDSSPELEAALEASGKQAELEAVRSLAGLARLCFVRQGRPLGLGHAVAQASPYLGGQPFAVLLPDDLLPAGPGLLRSMLDAHLSTGASVLALQAVGPREISAYGAARVEPDGQGLVRVVEVVEKPPPGQAPSDLAVMGRYVLTPGVLDALAKAEPGRGGEIQLTDAIGVLAGSEPVYGVVFSGPRHDVGSKLGYLQATVSLGLAHPEVGRDFRAWLAGLAAGLEA